ncbi:MAG: hypothetical protein WDW38_002848 [Sanguina aurantia]
MEANTGVTFADVAGVDEAKQDFEEHLTDTMRHQGSESSHAVGRHRGAGLGGGHDEREQTLNQLLVEMDGFEGTEGIIVIAATNRPDVLDPALLRPGRFDRQVTVGLPDVRGREQILKVHMRKVPTAADVNAMTIARGTPGFSGADLANLVNEAALFAARENAREVRMIHLDKARDKILMGTERRSLVMSEDERKLTAYHESGHAIIGRLVPEHDPVYKVTIIPRGRALGVTMYLPEGDKTDELEVGHAVCGTLQIGHDPVQKVTLVPRGQARGLTWFIPGEDASLISKSQIFARIVGALGGRAAEEVIFGDAEVTSGAASDLQQVTGMARQMVINYGMSDIGPWSLMDPSAQSGDVIMRMMSRNSMSENLQQKIDGAVRKISAEAYEVALAHIRDNREALDKITEALVEKETLTGEEFRTLLSQYTTIPEENRLAVRTKTPVMSAFDGSDISV